MNGTEKGKSFLECSIGERRCLTEKNYTFLKKMLIDWCEYEENFKMRLKEKGREIGIQNIEMITTVDDTIILGSSNSINHNFTDLFILLENEKNTENKEIIILALKSYLLINDITKAEFTIDLQLKENEGASFLISCHSLGFIVGLIEDFDHYFKKIKDNVTSKKSLLLIRKIELQKIYNENTWSIDLLIIDLMKEFIKEKIIEMEPFKNFLNIKIESIRKEMELFLQNLISIDNLETLLGSRSDIVFDEKGFAFIKQEK